MNLLEALVRLLSVAIMRQDLRVVAGGVFFEHVEGGLGPLRKRTWTSPGMLEDRCTICQHGVMILLEQRDSNMVCGASRSLAVRERCHEDGSGYLVRVALCAPRNRYPTNRAACA